VPEIIRVTEKQLSRFLFAVRYVERRPATDTKRGRPSRWPREKLVEAAGLLRAILHRETSVRVSLNSFLGQYLPILKFPSDVTMAAADQLPTPSSSEAARSRRLLDSVFERRISIFHPEEISSG
jgi:hypothetical protein